MAHPFEKMFEKALAKSHGDSNFVLGEAEKLKELGYPVQEIYEVLNTLKKSLISDSDEAVVAEALEEFSQYIDEEDEEG